jgi:hypothetical protein
MYDEGLAVKETHLSRRRVRSQTVALSDLYFPMIYILSETMRAGMGKQNMTKEQRPEFLHHTYYTNQSYLAHANWADLLAQSLAAFKTTGKCEV